MNADEADAVFVETLTKALQERAHGSSENYALVLKEFGRKDAPDATLAQWLRALKVCSSLLDKKLEPLVGLTLKIDWTRKDDAFVLVYMDYLVEIVSTKPIYVGPCVDSLVALFARSDEKDDEEKANIVFGHVHEAIQSILTVVPRAVSHIPAAVTKRFPFRTKNAAVHDCYLKNVLLLADYVSGVLLPILECVFYKMIEMDAELPRETEETQFDVELSGSKDEKEVLLENVDVMMSRLLAYCKNRCCPGDAEFLEKAACEFFEILLEVFMNCLLKIHGSCHVQFVIFYTCSLSEKLFAAYLERVWAKVESLHSSIIERQSAAMYIGSFIARAVYLPMPYVKEMMSYMVAWLHRYIEHHDRSSNIAASSHGPFYAVSQAVFCAFIFCHQCIIDMDDSGLAYLQSLNLARIVQCRLNPLKFCASTVVDMFALISRRYQLAFCYTVIEHNQRLAALSLVKETEDTKTLYTFKHFFPYDVYNLPKSGQIVRPLQRDFPALQHDVDHHEEENMVCSVESNKSHSWPEKDERYSLLSTSNHSSHLSPGIEII
ncbi:RNA polymerase I-specific transcription initiation factor RRN3-like isoform X2 [Oscarella lobularis]|uniref:RNA polymerase I-specific transcription initiation factor RRN3-like isoform X2 n=1 Tax=Oscarella lobularis TaxID=121494 RepID=UPI0033139261